MIHKSYVKQIKIEAWCKKNLMKSTSTLTCGSINRLLMGTNHRSDRYLGAPDFELCR